MYFLERISEIISESYRYLIPSPSLGCPASFLPSVRPTVCDLNLSKLLQAVATLQPGSRGDPGTEMGIPGSLDRSKHVLYQSPLGDGSIITLQQKVAEIFLDDVVFLYYNLRTLSFVNSDLIDVIVLTSW